MQRHRHQEFIRFLNRIEREVPTDKAIHGLRRWETTISTGLGEICAEKPDGFPEKEGREAEENERSESLPKSDAGLRRPGQNGQKVRKEQNPCRVSGMGRKEERRSGNAGGRRCK